MLTTVLVDDKATNIRLLTNLIGEYCPQLKIVGTAQNNTDASQIILKHQPDLVFLDIEIDQENGFDLVEKVKGDYKELIFVTAYEQYALKAIHNRAIDYLLKPIEIDALVHAVEKAEEQIRLKETHVNIHRYLQQHHSREKKILIPVLDGALFIDSQDIVCCNASGSYTHIILENGQKIVASMNLGQCQNLLPNTSFFRVHVAHLVNINFVSKYVRGRGGHLVMKDGSIIKVAANRKSDFLDLFNL